MCSFFFCAWHDVLCFNWHAGVISGRLFALSSFYSGLLLTSCLFPHTLLTLCIFWMLLCFFLEGVGGPTPCVIYFPEEHRLFTVSMRTSSSLSSPPPPLHTFFMCAHSGIKADGTCDCDESTNPRPIKVARRHFSSGLNIRCTDL